MQLQDNIEPCLHLLWRHDLLRNQEKLTSCRGRRAPWQLTDRGLYTSHHTQMSEKGNSGLRVKLQCAGAYTGLIEVDSLEDPSSVSTIRKCVCDILGELAAFTMS